MSEIPSWARVGAEVVCIDDCDVVEGDGVDRIVRGGRYVIKAVVPDAIWGVGPISHGAGVHLVGVTRFGGYPYGLFRFRPLITIEDDIATHFSALLDVREPERV